ncbi:DUF3307 domain-containing protein [Rhizobium phage RHph_I46]|uniref:DUF3307 domain-containing protein n=1 Tax=Rhizobium phage RHph_I1_9 TaxID=2509729 RepID=A0A7S5UWP2_9CAUD|nr:membrane protein [Rhizobium phage RHph_I1_9]QIG69633.1 DUF3307 domain-containing protein [Rhizobium phage RHph_I46]QIG70914.1 DUF3307 domain-containing protein [Rhizobium phage RHph_I9]QIG73500.1 DUF3307 domain-containing protein [Rhizobium phage RHph_I1_9]QIG76253.1 DUF3307 domain-containing protein [Rhizobium phage RHph_I34]
MFFGNPINLFILLLFAHYIADYPLQGPFLSRIKNPRRGPTDVDIIEYPWKYGMTAHCGIHAGFVLLLTGSIVLSVIEFFVHFATDWMKCEGWIGYKTDQFIHVATKAIYVFVLFFVPIMKFLTAMILVSQNVA